ncbi:MAG: hypothetical protein AAF389_05010 [Gemmatimonadota bacterium]
MRIIFAACAAGLFAAVVSVSPTAAQTLEELTETPDEAAGHFLRSVRAIRWETAAEFLHAETQQRFRATVEMIVDADTTGVMLAFLVEGGRADLGARPDVDVFDDAIGAVIDDMPGLMHAMYDRDDSVVGAVSEGDVDAHVVYRTTARISGATSEVKVMQLRETDAGWRVVWSDELEVLDAALRGISRRMIPPGS